MNSAADIRFIDLFELRFDFADIRLTDEIARGGYGLVYGAIRISTGEDLALKFFGYTRNRPRMKWIMEEIKLMASVRACPNAVQILGVFYDEQSGILPRKIHRCRYPVIVMERLKGEDIFYRIINSGRFSEQSASAIFASFIQAVHYLHKTSRIINCDLKAENVVFQTTIADDFRVKIIDFGTALPLQPDSDDVFDYIKRGTDSLIAPETDCLYYRLRNFVYSKQTDIWQAGCFLYILLLAALPFGEGEEAARRIHDCQPTISHLPPFFHSSLSDDAKDLILRMLDKNPSTRIKSEHILRHRWVRLITPSEFLCLQQKFVECCRGGAYANLTFPVQTAAATNNREVSLELFGHIVSSAGRPDLSHKEVFDIFDQDGSMTVDYLEFLLTLIPFRTDANEGNLVRLYFEVFDMDRNQSISQDELQWILSKLLATSSPSAAMDVEVSSGFCMASVMRFEEVVIAASKFEDIFRSIDTNGDGVISFEEFEAFFKVMNSRTTFHQSTMSFAAPTTSSNNNLRDRTC